MKQRAKAMRYLRKVEGVLRMDKIRSDDIQRRLGAIEIGGCNRNSSKKEGLA